MEQARLKLQQKVKVDAEKRKEIELKVFQYCFYFKLFGAIDYYLIYSFWLSKEIDISIKRKIGGILLTLK